MIYRLALDQVECISYFLLSNCTHNFFFFFFFNQILFFFFFLLPYITLFSLSSDIQGVGEGHPPACLTNYKYGVLMVGTLAYFFRSFIMHFEGNVNIILLHCHFWWHDNTHIVEVCLLFSTCAVC